MGVMGT